MFVHRFVPKVELYVVANDDEAAAKIANGVIDSLRYVLGEQRENTPDMIMSSIETPSKCTLVGAVNPKTIEKLGTQLELAV